MAASTPTPEPTTAVALLDKGLVAEFTKMITLIPAETDRGAEAIVAQILTATTLDDLDAPWDTASIDDVVGKVFRLERAERRPSDFSEGMGFFLVLHLTDIKTGEKVAKTTGAMSILAQVARAYALGLMPLFVEFVVAERPTRDGYHPHHLKVHGTAGASDATA